MLIAIDPGHGFANRRPGQYDPGAVAAGVSEADVCLSWALTGKWLLNRAGIAVWLTRDDDKDPDPVGTRDDRAESAGATHFISLHCNAANGKASGTETFYRDARDKTFAAIVQKSALAAMKGKDRGLKTEQDSQHSRLAVFDFDGPCCLAELGFLDHPGDRKKMLDREVRIAFWTYLLADLKAQND